MWLFTSIRDDDTAAETLDTTFSTNDERFGEVVTIDLKPGGSEIEVTEENKKEYVEYVKIFFNPLRVPMSLGSFCKMLTLFQFLSFLD